MTTNRVPNRLAREKSPYLLQHQYNPVDWFPWGEEAFAKAKAEDKPIFLSIGYSTCHWCHVMERESFEDEEVARVLNRDFIAIKVDREERPDIDHIYMEVCQALNGQGGWPLTIVATPEGKPFFAATYLPRDNRGRMSGLLELLPELARLWREERARLINNSEKMTRWLQQRREVNGELPGPELLARAVQQFSEVYDPQYGGFGKAPKFPTPHNLYFLLRYHHHTGDQAALDMMEKTLQAMYYGGIYDHIGFGFARYSTDRFWLVPHFEKMLYDNALLAIAYLEAFQLTRRDLYARVAGEIFDYVLRDMTSPEGGFYSAEDADSEGVEGKFYVWSPEEVLQVLGESDGQEFCRLYDITPRGNFGGKSIPHLPKTGISATRRREIEPWRQKLWARREERIHPHKDDKILTAWNGLMIAALAYGARVLERPDYLNAAEKAATFILGRLRREDGRLLARYREGQAQYPAYALDYACLIWGLLEIYASSYQEIYLRHALELKDDLLRYFWDDEQGGFYLYGSDAEQLVSRPKEAYDGAIPADNSIAALDLLRLARLTGQAELEDLVRRSLECFSREMEQSPISHAFLLIAIQQIHYPGEEVVVVGRKSAPDTRQMLSTLQQTYLPATLVVFKDADGDDLADLIPFTREMKMQEGRATAYRCQAFTCHPPTTNPADLIRPLSEFQPLE